MKHIVQGFRPGCIYVANLTTSIVPHSLVRNDSGNLNLRVSCLPNPIRYSVITTVVCMLLSKMLVLLSRIIALCKDWMTTCDPTIYMYLQFLKFLPIAHFGSPPSSNSRVLRSEFIRPRNIITTLSRRTYQRKATQLTGDILYYHLSRFSRVHPTPGASTP